MRFAERLGQVPAAVLVGEDVLLKTLVGGTSVADEDAALSLNVAASEQARARDGDEGIARRHYSVGPAIEAEGCPSIHLRRETLGVKAGAVKEIVGGVQEGKTADQGTGKPFPLQPCPRPGGVYLLEVIAPVELMREFEVVKDSKDGLCDFHER